MNTNGRELGQIRANLIIANERKLGRELNLTKAAAAGRNLIKVAGMSKNLSGGPYLRQVAPAAELNFTSTCRTAKFYFRSIAGLNFIFRSAARLNFIFR